MMIKIIEYSFSFIAQSCKLYVARKLKNQLKFADFFIFEKPY